MKSRCNLVFGLFAAALVQEPMYSRTAEESKPEKACTVDSEELQIFASYLEQGSASPQIVVSITTTTPPEVDTLKLVLGSDRHLPSDLGRDFNNRNCIVCTIKPLVGISNVHFISRQEYDSIFHAGWHEFRRKYGKLAEIVWLSRIGFNADRTLALLHVCYGTANSVPGGGALRVRAPKKWLDAEIVHSDVGII
jgi:hypothetical protein